MLLDLGRIQNRGPAAMSVIEQVRLANLAFVPLIQIVPCGGILAPPTVPGSMGAKGRHDNAV